MDPQDKTKCNAAPLSFIELYGEFRPPFFFKLAGGNLTVLVHSHHVRVDIQACHVWTYKLIICHCWFTTSFGYP